MPLMCLRSLVLLSAGLAAGSALAPAATRPSYGGTLHVEIREAIESADPPQTGPGMADLSAAFSITSWEGGRMAVYSANDDAANGRPFLDSVEIQMGRALRDQAIDLELGKADVVEIGPDELRRLPASRRIWSSRPVRLLALLFSPRVTDARIREALALSVDRGAIHTVLLQRQGEISGGLLPQWISGYAFLFPTAVDSGRARSLITTLPPPLRTLTLAVDDPAWRPIAERIAVNGRDAGLGISIGPSSAADVRLQEVRITSTDAGRALSAVAKALGLPEPEHSGTPDDNYAAERALLDGFRVIPLFHLPVLYGVGPRVMGGPGITPLGEWSFGGLWLERGHP